MLGVIGNLFIFSALFFSASVIWLELQSQSSRKIQIISCSCISASMLSLIYGFVASDFSLQNVFINSSTLSPLLYKVAASWSSHEGSMLFFITILSIVCLYSDFRINNSSIKSQATVLQQSIISALLLAIWISANPFKLSIFTPHEGVGLNPLLQDVALAWHPPILYLGYAFFFVPFCYCVLLYKDRQGELNNLYSLLEFSRLAMMCLTLGIALGSWWAYRELGWGGYWFFDPVENISLLPWLCGIAFHHSMLSSIKKNMLKKWTVLLGAFVFPLPLFGMFLVRSNLLISVHSFALDATKAAFLGLVSLTSIAISIYGIMRYESREEKKIAFYSKEAGFVVSNIFWLIAIFSILASIAIPICLHIVYGISLSLEADYFRITLLPILIAINIITGIYSYMSLIHYSSWTKQLLSGSIAILLSCTLIYYFEIKQVLANLAIVCSCFLLTASLVEFIIKSNFLRQALRLSQTAMILGHISYAILSLSIALNVSLEDEAELIGAVGTAAQMKNFEITLQDITYSYGPNYLRQIASVKISDKKSGDTLFLKPENRWYVIENKMTAESSIYSFLSYDLYAVLNRIDKDNAHVKIYYRPYISFIWLASITMALSFFISIFAIKKRFVLADKSDKV